MNLDFSKLRILVYGDVMLDEYVHGIIERISPEAPVPILRETHREYRPGGAANVAANVAALGAKVILYGLVGRDKDGRTLAKISPNPRLLFGRTKTIRKTRFVAQRGSYVLRVDDETGEPWDGGSIREGNFDAIIVADYGKGAVTREIWKRLIAFSKPIFCGTKLPDWNRYEGSLCIACNDAEFEVESLKYSSSTHVLVTMGDKGMRFLRRSGECLATWLECPATPREVVDVTGAGDTALAMFSLAMIAGNHDMDSMRMANAAGGIVVGKLGTSVATIDEVKAILE